MFPTLSPITSEGRSIASLFLLELALSALVLLLVVVPLVYAVVRFRSRPGAPEPRQVPGNNRLEYPWTATAALLATALFIGAVVTMSRVNASPASTLRVQVIGHQWWWEYRYPELNVVTANELHLPVGETTRLELTGADVVHSFWVPRLGWKQDAIPGTTNVMTAHVEEAATIDGACAEYCGIEHATMRIRVVTEPRAAFDAWAQGQRQPADPPPGAAHGLEVFQAHTCVNCHTIRGTQAAGTVGPDLTHVGGRATIAAGVLENTPDNLQRWVQHADQVKPGVLMPSFTSLSDADARALADFLDGLK